MIKVKRVGQGCVIVCSVIVILIMTWQHNQQLSALNSISQHEEKVHAAHIMTLVEREIEVIEVKIEAVLAHLAQYPTNNNTINAVSLADSAKRDAELLTLLARMQESVSLDALMLTQNAEVYPLLALNEETANKIHLQKHYEWLSQDNASPEVNKRSVIISSRTDKKSSHFYYSLFLHGQADSLTPVMATFIVDIQQLQRILLEGNYLLLDGVKYLPTSHYSRLRQLTNSSPQVTREFYDTIGDRKLWGKWAVGSDYENRGREDLLFAVNRNYQINILIVIMLVLFLITVIELAIRSNKVKNSLNQKLIEKITLRESELNKAIASSEAVCADLFGCEVKLRSIIDSSIDGIIICDSNSVISDVNHAVKRLFGYEKNDVIGKSVDFLFPHYVDQVGSGDSIIDYDGESFLEKFIETNAISKDNRFIEVKICINHAKIGNREIFIVMVRDISDRVKNQNEIRDVQQNLRAVIDNIAEGIITSDEVGNIMTFNPAAEVIFGWDESDIVGQNISVLMGDNDRENHDGYIKQYKKSRTRNVLGKGPREVVGVRKNGELFHMELATSEMINADKRIFIAIFRDVTERKVVEKNMHTSYSELESVVDSHTDDLTKVNKELVTARDDALVAARSKSEFLAMMSHEIRTPINGVLGMLSLVRDTDLNEVQHDYIESAYSSGEILLALLNDVLDLSKIDAGHMELDCRDFDIYQAVEKSVHITSKTLHDHDIEIACFISKDVPRFLNGDAGRLRQVLSNLISNAVKFTKKGGVSVSISMKSMTENSCEIDFEVLDTGIGIEEMDLDRIFNEFSQADNSERRNYGGTGLGLSICKRFVSMMEGEISVESVPGQGSCFSFTANFNKCGESSLSVDFNSSKVLLLSDHDVIKSNFFTQLNDWGCELQLICSDDILNNFESIALNGDEVVVLEFAPELYEDFLGHLSAIMTVLKTSAIKTIIVENEGVSLRPFIDEGDDGQVLALSRPVLPAELLSKIDALIGTKNMSCMDSDGALNHKENKTDNLAGISVLVAEDNIVNQKVISAMLKKIGVIADIVNNGSEAIAALSNPDHAYQLVLMDCQMPEVDGYVATRQLRRLEKESEQATRIPVIAMTAHALPGDREKCMDAGMDDYITKPINLNVVKTVIENWL